MLSARTAIKSARPPRHSRANYYVNTGDPVRAIEASHWALTAATAVADTGIEVSTNLYLSRPHNALGDYATAASVSRRNVELPDRATIGPTYLNVFNLPLHSRCALASSLAELGQFVEAIACANEGARMADATERAFPIIAAPLDSGPRRMA